MQHVKMLETRDGASDRVTVITHHEGNVYLVSDDLAEIFIRDGAAELAEADDMADNVPALEELDAEQLKAKILTLDPDADPDQVEAAIANDRERVLEIVKELEALDAAPGGEPADAEFDGLSNKDLVELAHLEDVKIPFTARSRAAKIDAIKAARAAKQP